MRDAAASYGGPGGVILLYNAPDGTVRLDVRLERETLWLSQKQMALLFDTERSVITKHLGNIFKSGELDRDSVCANFAQPAADGKTYRTDFFNLDAVISVGYRVNSKRCSWTRTAPFATGLESGASPMPPSWPSP